MSKVVCRHAPEAKQAKLARAAQTFEQVADLWLEKTASSRAATTQEKVHGYLKEHPGIFVESFNHLAALDKWAHDAGYCNRKSVTIVYVQRPTAK